MQFFFKTVAFCSLEKIICNLTTNNSEPPEQSCLLVKLDREGIIIAIGDN
jgi:hypothetical protein